jgi:hypothetical protein
VFLHRHVQLSFRVIFSHSRWTNSSRSRHDDLRNWADLFKTIRRRTPDLKIYACANNHYQGHGPGTVKLLWEKYKSQSFDTNSASPVDPTQSRVAPFSMRIKSALTASKNRANLIVGVIFLLAVVFVGFMVFIG